MQQNIYLSDYNRTCEMYSIVQDRENNNLIKSNQILEKIVKCFLNKLNNNDQQLAIKYLTQYFPQNQSLIQAKVGNSITWKFFNDYGLKKNEKAYKQHFNLNVIRLDEDFDKLIQLFDSKEFLENVQIPTLFVQNQHIIKKLKLHSFKLFDLLEQCQYPSFQLNSTILSHLVFFFFIPEELQINNKEKFELYKLLGQITCECWMQYEYHVQKLQLKFQEQSQNKLTILSQIPQLLFEQDLKILSSQMQQVLKPLFDKNDQMINFDEINNLIQKRLPILFELQVIFYQICFYCIGNFNQFYEKNMIKTNKDEKYKQLNMYIQQKKQQGFEQLNQVQTSNFKQYQDEQGQIEEELQILDCESFDNMLQLIIEDDFYSFNKRQHIIHLSQKNEQQAKIFNLLTEIPEEDKRKVVYYLKKFKQFKNIIDVVEQLQQQKETYPKFELEIIFRIIIELQNLDYTQYLILKQELNQSQSKAEMQNLLDISQYNENLKLNEQIKLLMNFQDDHWQLIKNKPIQYIIYKSLIKQFKNIEQENLSIQIINYLRKLFDKNQGIQQLNEQTIFFTQLFSSLEDEQIHKLFIVNKSEQICEYDYIFTIETVFKVLNSIKDEEYSQFKSNLEKALEFNKIYSLNFFFELQNEKIQLEQLQNIYQLIYYLQFNQQQKLLQNAIKFYKLNAILYKQIFLKINYFENKLLFPEKLEILVKSDIYPRGLNIQLEEFNISLTLLTKQEQEHLVKKWIKDVKHSENFKELIPFFFNIIKRGESSRTFLSLINQQIKTNKQLQQQYSYFNQKSIFQVFYNNANDELKVMLLKLQSKQYPIPLLYRIPYNAETNEIEKLTFNINTFYVCQDSFPIINLSLDENQKRIGKTELINKIFYDQDKFEISDSNQLNNQTIDIMFDYEFSGSRNLSVADAHNFIPFDILDDILPIFKLWIIQLDTEKEIEMTIENLQKLKSIQIQDKVVCFLIRNSNQNLEDNQIQLLKSFNIQYKQIQDLSDKDLSKQMKDDEIEQVSKFLYDIINQNRTKFTVNQEQYFNLICQMKCQDPKQTKDMMQAQVLFQDIEKELETQMKHEQGFYNQNAFPLRSIDWQIKQQKDEYIRIEQNMNFQKSDKLKQINQNIKDLQSQITQQKPTKLITEFCSLLQAPNYYILYLHFVDLIRKFNEKNTYELQDKNQKLNEDIQKLKREKDALKLQNKDKEINQDYIQQRDEIQKQIEEQVNKLKQNSEIISKINIGIELFWREIISQIDQCRDSKIDIDPAKIVKEMISKGEPFEFLDGDQLRIDQSFLKKLVSNFKEKGQEKILVFSVIGPQSSGKSTILNKIFGCHFWTSVGRCTKGIYLQLLKIHNKEYFNNQFEYIIILDTEGLQSPNQDDQEFDKKIALFVLSISDIILVNVKGDITREFRSLVEMCIYTLGQMKSFTSTKQITWCFNQNNDVRNFAPFLAQLQSIATSLSTEFSNQKEEDEVIDYTKILGITKENIDILGFASTEKLWEQNESGGIYANWRQLIINGTFSKEAYEYGIRVIKSYVDNYGKADDQQEQEKQMENLKYFIEKIETTWKSICSLPDLLEFSQLIQHQQNQFMRQQFNEIMEKQVFPNKNEFILNIQTQIKQNNQKLSFEILNNLERQQNLKMQGQFDQIKKQFIERLTSIKNEKKISKKVFTKYVNMVKDRINSEESAFNLAIYNEIKTQETNLQKQKGFLLLDQFIYELLKKEDELQKYKKDENKIKQKFDEIWGKIKNEHIQQQEEIFQEYCNKLLQAIKQEFSKYILTTDNEPQYKQEFHQKLIKKAPEPREFLTSLEILMPELQTQQFMFIENDNKNYQFYQNFYQTIHKKIEKLSNKNLIQLNQFYSYKIELRYISKYIIDNYIKTDMSNDLKQYYKDNKKNEKHIIKNYLQQFTIFGYDIDEKQVDKIYDKLNGWFGNDIQQFLNLCFKPNQKRLYFKDTYYYISIDFIKTNCKGVLKHIQQKEQISQLQEKLENLIKPYDGGDQFIFEMQQSLIVSGEIESLKQDFEKSSQNSSNLSDQSKQQPLSQINSRNVQFTQSHSDHAIQYQKDDEINNIFSYIENQKNYQLFPSFKSNIVKVIQIVMKQNNNDGWNKMYGEIHQMILDEIVEVNKNTIAQENENVKVNQYNYSLIKRIMQKIEVKIKEFNMQFSDFGVILNDFGERCVFYYAIFTIWRILCFGQYQSTESNIKELKDQTDEQYKKFKADIQQNKKEQSQIRGQKLVQEIINQATQRFYMDYCQEAQQIIVGYSKESSFDLIRRLDNEILERSDKNITDDQIIEYIRNQSKYIEDYVKNKIINIKQEIQTKLTEKLRKDFKSHLQKVLANTKNLDKFVSDNIKAQDYFKELNNSDEAPELLYKIVLSCLNGKVDQKLLDQIKEDKRDAFSTQDFNVFQQPLCMPIQQSDAQIQILQYFVQAFQKKINDGIQSFETIQIEFEKLNVQAELDALQLKQLGCLESCPICKRKCDQEIDDSNHKHQCQNGHQLRGMSGVIIGKFPSLFTCEEIQDDFQIKELTTQNIKQWKEIKQIYNTWQFSCLSKDELKQVKEKFMKIWNNNIGQIICKKLTQEFKKEIFYFTKDVELEENQRIYNYILMLDDSGSMCGQHFESAKNGLVAFLSEIQKNPSSRVTIIIFNDSARCVVDCQVPNVQAQQSQIQFKGGYTDFNAAFLLAYDKIAQNADFHKFHSHSIFFYTDGGALYPQQAMNKFQQLPPEKRYKIELIACSEEKSPSTLIKIEEFFKNNFRFAKLQNSMEPEKIAQVWIEEVNKLTKQNKNC